MTSKEKYVPTLIALSLITIGIALRLIPHPANFAPITAIALFGGSVLPKKIAVWVPLGAMVISDALIGFYPLMPLIWACYLVIALASARWLQQPSLVKGAVVTVGSSLFFFVVTNFGVWIWSGMYAHSWAGLMNCYVLALPFFRNTLLSDIVFTSMLFGLYRAASASVVRERPDTTYIR